MLRPCLDIDCHRRCAGAHDFGINIDVLSGIERFAEFHGINSNSGDIVAGVKSSDLNAGLIDETQARERRKAIGQEADFYGAMDGASKFVKGDAVAGIVIIIVNIVGGLSIGVLQQGVGAGEALNLYAGLTVGDGLVSQLPALLISTATGIIVTRAASDTNLGTQMFSQLTGQSRPLIIAGTMKDPGIGVEVGSVCWFGLNGLPRHSTCAIEFDATSG